MIGPLLPVAACKSCGALLTFEVRHHHVSMGPVYTIWRCECPACSDEGERTTSADGDTAWDALTELAACEWDCEPEELLR